MIFNNIMSNFIAIKENQSLMEIIYRIFIDNGLEIMINWKNIMDMFSGYFLIFFQAVLIIKHML